MTIALIVFFLISFIKELFQEKHRAIFYFISLFILTLYSTFFIDDFLYSFIFSFLTYTTLLLGFSLKFYLPIFLLIISINFFAYNTQNLLLVSHLILPFLAYLFYFFYKKNTLEFSLAQELLLKKSKELSIIRKTSLTLQKTLDYEELIDILLNTLTSKDELNFDRTLLFLFDERINSFIPFYLKYKNNKEKISLNTPENSDAHEEYRMLQIENSIVNPFGKSFDTKEPIVIETIDNNDKIQVLINSLIGANSFGLIPLIEKNTIKGIVLVDNFISSAPITNEELDNTVSIIHQASTALINSSLYKQSQDMAYKDGLTSLFNKRYLDFSFEKDISKLLNKELELFILVIDVDYFKHYNDTNGHISGNDALKRIADLLVAESRNKDTVTRFGGEEFCILLFDIDLEGALGVAERIRFRIEKEKFFNEISQPNKKLTISIGLASYSGERALDRLLEKADKALYQAKKQGRNRVVIYSGGESDV